MMANRHNPTPTKHAIVNLKLTPGLHEKLQVLCRHAHRNRCAVLRTLIAQATPEDLPRSWQDPHEAALLAEVEG
jgi:hypothetical protein